MASYRIVRKHAYRQSDNVVLRTGLTLEQAQTHCTDPETSSSTCTLDAGHDYTRVHGPRFDVYQEECYTPFSGEHVTRRPTFLTIAIGIGTDRYHPGHGRPFSTDAW